MKSNLFLFTGFGFLGLNLARYFKDKKYKVTIIGKKEKFPFKTKFISKKISYTLKILVEDLDGLTPGHLMV